MSAARPTQQQETKPDDSSGAGSDVNGGRAGKSDFRRGNINFDFLQPEVRRRTEAENRARDRRGGRREGKRGLFKRGRPPSPVGPLQTVAWALVFFVSIVAMVWVFMSSSIVWLLLVPLLVATTLWSLLMLALFKARPR